MLEIPEAVARSQELTKTLSGRTIRKAVAGASPHGFAFYFGDPEGYNALLSGQTLGAAKAVGGQVEIDAGSATLLFNDGINLRYYAADEKLPDKHQLCVSFEDGASLVGTVQMYGGLMAYPNGANDNPYYIVAKEKPSPLTDAFDEAYFERLLEGIKPSLSAKALLATEQRIPGLGNGVLQDILFVAGVHPKTPARALSDDELARLYRSVKETLSKMTNAAGRDTERDLFGNEGGYRTLLSRKTLPFPCPKCGGAIQRKAYLGGNIYYCDTCQVLHNTNGKH